MDARRAPNFTAQEEKILVSLAKKYSHILENKMSNVDMNTKKVVAWKKIEEEYNSSVGSNFREVKVLRKKYENIKKRSKRKFADEKAHVMGTGGGSQMDSQINEIDIDIKEILGTRLEGLHSEFDDDAVVQQPEEVYEAGDCIIDETEEGGAHYDLEDWSPSLPTNNAIVDDHTYYADQEPSTSGESKHILSDRSDSKWSKCEPEKLKKNVSKPLVVADKKKYKTDTIATKISQWAAAKTEIEEFKKGLMKEKHMLELQILKDESDARIALMKEDQKSKIKLSIFEKHPNLSKEQINIIFNKISDLK
ncbi:uncharacterized protein [Diabrotica undecimpunctata]|uniref:uncharacterized protein n=1 Tax=Diabrotica undecimpunctata TaxID=50387 RepID=UPI003B636F16